MLERINPSETPFGKEWVIFGQLPGLKTEDLLAFEKTKPRDVLVLPGISIGASLFSDFLSQNSFGAKTRDKVVKQGQLPEALIIINKQIVSLFSPNKPVIVRSSATDECGGSGIYDSAFFVPTGNIEEDLKRLIEAERQVYASYFREEANLFRDGQFSNAGMGLLLQPVIGDNFANYFFPAFSGVFTVINGEMVMKVVPGLGTRAVTLGEDNIMRGNFDPFVLPRFKKFDAINLTTGEIESLQTNSYILDKQFQQIETLMTAFDSWRNAYSKGQTTYWEFVVDESYKRPLVVQSALEPQPPLDLEFEPPEGKILLETSDIANIGIRRGRGILVLFVDAHQIPVDVQRLTAFNKTHKNFLLAVPDMCLTSQTQVAYFCQLKFPYFSNASGILELHYLRDYNIGLGIDHEVTPGGSHFLELCRKKNILFLGTRADQCKPLLEYRSRPFGHYSLYWDLEFKITNTRRKGRIEILDKST